MRVKMMNRLREKKNENDGKNMLKRMPEMDIKVE